MTELTGIGAELRRAREAQGLALDDVAQQLKFATRQIESLENERFDRLPGPTIARGMVRNYARLLNLDPEPLVARMSPKVEQPAASGPVLKPSVPFSPGGRRSTLIYAGFSVAVLLLAGMLAYEWQQERATPQFVAPAQPPRPPEPVAAPAPAPEPAPQMVAEAPQPEPAPPVEKKVVEKKAAERKVEKKAVEKPAAEVAAKPEAETPPLQAAGGKLHRIELTCQEDSWIEVKDGTGRALVSSLNPAGCERLVRGRGPFEIVIGNARGVTLIVDGKAVDLAPHTRGDRARVTFQ